MYIHRTRHFHVHVWKFNVTNSSPCGLKVIQSVVVLQHLWDTAVFFFSISFSRGRKGHDAAEHVAQQSLQALAVAEH